ncbi:unnamed protein product [Prunus armeniaca]
MEVGFRSTVSALPNGGILSVSCQLLKSLRGIGGQTKIAKPNSIRDSAVIEARRATEAKRMNES